MIGIVDYGMGNLGSIANMLEELGVPHEVSADVSVLASADHLILPGVGAFDRGMAALDEIGLIPVLEDRVRAGIPVLGICLGMQLLARRSEEGVSPGLGWIDADVVRFSVDHGAGLRIPHMGWNTVDVVRASDILPDDGEPRRFYFVHSFHMVCDDPSDVVATTTHGTTFPSVVQRGNVSGVQFHPEKSHRFGLELLGRFAALTRRDA